MAVYEEDDRACRIAAGDEPVGSAEEDGKRSDGA